MDKKKRERCFRFMQSRHINRQFGCMKLNISEQWFMLELPSKYSRLCPLSNKF